MQSQHNPSAVSRGGLQQQQALERGTCNSQTAGLTSASHNVPSSRGGHRGYSTTLSIGTLDTGVILLKKIM